MAKAKDGSKQRRERPKGFPWLSGDVINHDRSLGKPMPDRPSRHLPVVIMRRKKGGVQVYEAVRCFEAALELNARMVCAYVEAARYETVPPETERALGNLPDLCDRQYKKAIRGLTNYKSVRAHESAIAETVAHAVREKRHLFTLAQLLRIRRALDKGSKEVRSLRDRQARFVRDSIDNNRKPSEAVLLKTFLPGILAGSAEAHSQEINVSLAADDGLREASDVTVGDLALMAYHAQVNPAAIYPDFGYLGDLLDLAVHAGAHAMGFSALLDAADAATYSSMLCMGGEDPETDLRLRRERADLAAALRNIWWQVPELVEVSRRHGRLAGI